MDLKALLEKIDQFAGEKVGQKPGDQWRGDDPNPPGKKLVGSSESVLKDLSKGPTPKTREQELAEEFQAFLEAEFKDTVDKRPARKNSRPSRGHAPQPRYKTVKTDESYMSDKDIELQDYRSMTNQEFQTAYGINKMEWINQNKALIIQNPKLKQALGLEEGAEQDPIVATVVKQMRPGLTGLDMGNEAFLYFAYELGKQRARDAWEDYLPAIRSAYEQGLNEGWESGPEEYQEPYDDADDAYDRQRQEKIDTEAEAEWAKLPKVSTYKLVGRGPNMESNYEFGDEFDTMEQALEYRAKIMKDPKTPHPEHIGIRTITRVVDKESTNEAITPPGSSVVKNIDDYIRRRDEIFKALADPKQKDNYPWYKQALFDLNRMAKQAGIKIEESRAHKQLDTWFKNRELADKFAKGELKVPTPQERQAQLKKLEKEPKQVKEYGADNTVSATSSKQNIDPVQAQKLAQNLNSQKTALGQLRQMNPEIEPQKAANAMAKDTQSMTAQEKEELAQVAKTLSPALGTPAFGSIKTAIQKSQIQTKK